jgi:D-arabinose 1-dehydrogenase-like Zn-dependent alcohol dehydrogenase
MLYRRPRSDDDRETPKKERQMTSTHSMQAAVLESHGSSFRLGPIPRPEPAQGQVLVRIKASAVNPLDLKISKGQAAHARHTLETIGEAYEAIENGTAAGKLIVDIGD